eukprot:scaffold106429_cov64-Phaeocystis_antarctica.AAC.1
MLMRCLLAWHPHREKGSSTDEQESRAAGAGGGVDAAHGRQQDRLLRRDSPARQDHKPFRAQ